MEAFAILENRKTQLDQPNSFYFHGVYEQVQCRDYHRFEDALLQLERLRKAGKFLVGYIAYEAVYAIDPTILSARPEVEQPLLHFYVFDCCDLLEQKEITNLLNSLQSKRMKQPQLKDFTLGVDQDSYVKNLNQIKHYLTEGHTYQINYTSKYRFNYDDEPLAIYQWLRQKQKVAYSAFLQFDDYHLLSLSPELFFKKVGCQISSKPMKGTMPRSSDALTDKKNKAFLTRDEKTLAENIIIVDLIRNDLNKIAKTGTVKVPRLFQVESYETVYQLVSEVQCQLPSDIGFAEIVKGLFPCGSITGAPKKRSLQIIRELEKENRGIYTGAIGYIMPNNDMCFNVAIRTARLQNSQGELGVGGGIVHDSDALAEFDEMRLKAKFLMEAS